MLFIADEVMTGFGRTGAPFAIEHWGVTPDLIACAKGISGGYTPLGAVIVRPEIVGEVRGRGKSFVIGHTAAANPLSCATGAAVLRYVLDHNLTANAADTGAYLLEPPTGHANTPADRWRCPRHGTPAWGRIRPGPGDEGAVPAAWGLSRRGRRGDP